MQGFKKPALPILETIPIRFFPRAKEPASVPTPVLRILLHYESGVPPCYPGYGLKKGPSTLVHRIKLSRLGLGRKRGQTRSPGLVLSLLGGDRAVARF